MIFTCYLHMLTSPESCEENPEGRAASTVVIRLVSGAQISSKFSFHGCKSCFWLRTTSGQCFKCCVHIVFMTDVTYTKGLGKSRDLSGSCLANGSSLKVAARTATHNLPTTVCLLCPLWDWVFLCYFRGGKVIFVA